MVNQELDLVFVGTKHCIFSDDILSALSKNDNTILTTITTPHFGNLNVYKQDLSNSDYYLIGVDTAQSDAYSAIQIFSFKNFEQVAELQGHYSYTAFGQIIDFTFQWLRSQVGDRIMLCVENNTIGQAPIEHLRWHVQNFNYEPYLYREDETKQDNFGIRTNGLSKPLMIGSLIEVLEESCIGIKSKQLITQFSSMEQTPGGTVKSTGYCDLFMATCFCAYVRRKKAIEIMPLIEFTPKQIENKVFNELKVATNLMNIKQKQQSFIFTSEEDINSISGTTSDNDSFFPIFSG